jgi:glutamate-1-semialdehyde 2,1-aminomutase
LLDQDDAVGVDRYAAHTAAWMGERCPRDGLFFGLPSSPRVDAPATNAFVDAEVARRGSASRGLMLVRPNDDPAAVEAALDRAAGRLVGFKVYHTFARRTDTPNAELHEYLPRWMWEIADRRGLVIMLHIVRPRALADASNQAALGEALRAFAGARLVLAHAGRGFCADHTVDGIDALRGLENVFFDTSAICEPGAFEAIVRHFGVGRLLFGTDFPISNFRGRCTSVGDGFFWLYEHNVDWAGSSWTGAPTLVGIDSLLGLRQACRQLGLRDADVERIFCTNARDLLGLARHREALGAVEAPDRTPVTQPATRSAAREARSFAGANGVEVTDAEGRRLIDMSEMGGDGACLLGYADPDVNAADVRRTHLGWSPGLNSPDATALASSLAAIHPWAAAAHVVASAHDATATAVRAARTATRRNVVAAGVDAARLATTEAAGRRFVGADVVWFDRDDPDALRKIFQRHSADLAAIVLEPEGSAALPMPARATFLAGARELADQAGAWLVFDEIATGFRLHRGGAHLRDGVAPDVALFGRSLSNGLALGAIVADALATDEVVRAIGFDARRSDTLALAAAVAVLAKTARHDVPAHVAHIASRFGDALQAAARSHDVPLNVSGHAAMRVLEFDHPHGAALQRLFELLMRERGFLAARRFFPSLMHEPRHVDAYAAAAEAVFAELHDALARGDVPGTS